MKAEQQRDERTADVKDSAISSLMGTEMSVFERLEDLQRRIERVETALAVRNELRVLQVSDRFSIEESLARIADALAPQPADIVDSPYVAKRLDCTTTWVAEMARAGEIPPHCIVTGTGNGRPWKFFRQKIDQWIASR